MRDNFSSKTKEVLAKRVGYRCSNPNCRALTCGPSSDRNKFVSIGVAAHISAASKGGPRFREDITHEERSAVDNGIWLCQNCSKLIDSDPNNHPDHLLQEWKVNSEKLALNLIAKKTAKVVHSPELLEQLSTFARVDFQYSIPYKPVNDKEDFQFFKTMASVLFRMIACSYLQTSRYIKRDKFVFALSFETDYEDGELHFFGELITHLTPFGYYFGVFAEMLNNRKIDDIIDYINSFPDFTIRQLSALGKIVPYKISRINPTKVNIEVNERRFIFEKGLITTSDLLTFLASSIRTGVTVFDDINDQDSLIKIMTLLDKIQSGFDFSEVSIDHSDPEKWYVND